MLFLRKNSMRITRKEFTSYDDCKAILNNQSFSPTPYRYRHPKPFMKPFADWIKYMLLYNDEGHMRLKHSYPKLNHMRHVIESYEEFINKSLSSLISNAILTNSKNGKVDIMKEICSPLPWIVMQYITGLPKKGIIVNCTSNYQMSSIRIILQVTIKFSKIKLNFFMCKNKGKFIVFHYIDLKNLIVTCYKNKEIIFKYIIPY
jgi:hypothetical protein